MTSFIKSYKIKEIYERHFRQWLQGARQICYKGKTKTQYMRNIKQEKECSRIQLRLVMILDMIMPLNALFKSVPWTNIVLILVQKWEVGKVRLEHYRDSSDSLKILLVNGDHKIYLGI